MQLSGLLYIPIAVSRQWPLHALSHSVKRLVGRERRFGGSRPGSVLGTKELPAPERGFGRLRAVHYRDNRGQLLTHHEHLK
jgi:hypothetical protein